MKKVITVTFGDVDLSPYFIVSNITMPFLYKDNKYDQVGLSDGEQLTYSRNAKTPITIEGTILSENSDLKVAETRDHLISLLSGNVTKQLKLSNYPDRYFDAIFEGTQEYDGTFDYIAKVDLVFMVPDGIAHSVATQTADNMPYKNVPVNMLTGTAASKSYHGTDYAINPIAYVEVPIPGTSYSFSANSDNSDHVISIEAWAVDADGNRKLRLDSNTVGPNSRGSISCMWPLSGVDGAVKIRIDAAWTNDRDSGTYIISHKKLEIGTTASPWSPNPADSEYYTNTITVHNGGTYPVEPVITATMHADNGMVGIVNDRPGILQFGTQEIDGFTTEESEVALKLAAVQGSHMDNQAATNNPYWGGDPSMPNEQIGNAIWTHDDYDGWKVEPNWPSITGAHKYWNGPSIKHNLVQTHNGNFKSNLTWDVMTRFQTGVAQVGALETTLESDGKPIFQMILKDNSALSDQIWWMCYYKNQLVVNEQLDRSIFTNEKFIQLELQKFGNSVVFRVSPWVGNQGRETTITRQFTFADAANTETKQFSTWFMRDKTWGESTMYLIASTVKWQNVSWYTNIKNRFSNGDVLKIDVANAKTYLNGSLDPTMHTIGNQWEQFKLPPGDTKIGISHSSWAQPFACEVEIREAWL
ncbi:distal tail protein Dit [Lacticaseibacillus paracasei]|uniref:distal tail protein Dit n=1 Tax=Lacticaseibacillus paracasei TaxID=1597 RepID=UPI00194E9405|nr:distal tail protein Dit [Lacticaseibacillus paracasei]MBM6413978.1 phage tail family protein [Lacticaseibacillus paracasei]